MEYEKAKNYTVTITLWFPNVTNSTLTEEERQSAINRLEEAKQYFRKENDR